MDLLSQIDSATQYASELDRYLRRIHTEDRTETFSDGESSGHLHKQWIGRDCRIFYGHVVDAIAYCHWYKVQPDGLKTPIPCCMLSGTALTPFGVREHNQLQPNARVFGLLHPSSPYGVIIGVEPSHMFDPRAALSDYISLSSHNGIQIEDAHRFPFTLHRNGTIVDWSAGRPADGTAAGEKGWFAESGVGVFLDSAMAFLRADENCGVWAFYRDQLLRLSGHNLQIRSGGMEWECLDDQDEFNVTQGYTPYPWEQLGGLTPAVDVHREVTEQSSQIDEPYYSRLEPAVDDQQPFHRTRHYYGYLGQGGRREVVAPPAGGTLNRYSDPSAPIGLFQENISLTGQYTLQSAKGVRLVKRLLNPSAKVFRRPEDALGDNETNYKAAGLNGNGAEHVVKGDLTTSGDDPAASKALGVLDAHAYGSNYESMLPFAAHINDFIVPDESDLAESIGAPNIARLQFDRIAAGARMPTPDPTKIRVDHRYGDVNYYPTYSYVELSDDGGVALGDGFGSSIKMNGGDMVLAPTGDIILQPGRRVIIMSGTDVIIRSNNNVDISATTKDIRLYSGGGTHLSGKGILLEDRSESLDFASWRDNIGSDVVASGIVLKSAQAGVTALADFVYLRTGVTSSGQGIYLDSGQGEGPIITTSLTWDRYIGQAAADYFGIAGSVQTVNYASASSAEIGTPLSIRGRVLISEFVMADGWFYSASGHYASALSEQYEGKVGELKDEPLDQVKQALSDAESTSDGLKEAGEEAFTIRFTDFIYGDEGPGSEATANSIGFSFRTEEQYQTEQFRLYETSWQQLARLWGIGMTLWAETPVERNGEETYPFPGRQKFVEEAVFYTQDPVMFDALTGAAAARGSQSYLDAAHGTPQANLLNSTYFVF